MTPRNSSAGINIDQELFKSFIVFKGLKKLFKLNAKYPYPPPNPSYEEFQNNQNIHNEKEKINNNELSKKILIFSL